MIKVTATMTNIIQGLEAVGCTVTPDDRTAIGEVLHLLDPNSAVELENRGGKIVISFEVDVAAQAEHLKAFVAIEEGLGFSVTVGETDAVSQLRATVTMVKTAAPAPEMPTKLAAAMNAALEKKEHTEDARDAARKQLAASLRQAQAQTEQIEIDLLETELAQGAKAAEAAEAAVKPAARWYNGTAAKAAAALTATAAVAGIAYYGWKLFNTSKE